MAIALLALAAASYTSPAAALYRAAPSAPALPSRACVSMLAPAAAPAPAASAKASRRSARSGAIVAAARFAAGAAAACAARPALAAAAAAAAAAPKLHIGQRLALQLARSGLPDEAVLALISMLPVVELRGAVPVGRWLGVPPLRTFAVCVLGNTLAVVLLLAALRLPLVESLLRPVLDKARAKMGTLADSKNLPLGLAVFVGVPLPGTGGWTGAMIAHLLGMPFGLAAASISAGVVMAGVIMSALTLAGWYGAAAAGAGLALFCAGALLNRGKD